MVWNKPAFSKFYSTDELKIFPNLGTVFIHLTTIIHVSEDGKLGTASAEELRILHDIP
jgi:hypothetical protein